MCQVHLIHSLNNKLSKEDISTFKDMMELGDIYNNDAYGIISDAHIYTKRNHSFNKLTQKQKKELIKRLEPNKFLVGHNRMTTNGGNHKKNSHPFETKDFLLVHNGIIQNDQQLKKKHDLEYKEGVDSIIMVKLIQKYTDEGMKVADAIVKTMEQIEGYYSVILTDKRTNKLYYYKNRTAKFTFGLIERQNGKKILIGSTDSENIESVYTKRDMIFEKDLTKNRYYTEPIDGMIYEINESEIKEIQSFKPKTKTSCKSWDNDDYAKRFASWDEDIKVLDNTKLTASEEYAIIDEAEREIYSLTGHNHEIEINPDKFEVLVTVNTEDDKILLEQWYDVKWEGNKARIAIEELHYAKHYLPAKCNIEDEWIENQTTKA